MAVLMRRGTYGDFEPSKLKAGEWAVVLGNDPSCTDGKAAYICFSAGVVKRMSTYEDMVEQFGLVADDVIQQLTDGVDAVIVAAQSATNYANAAGLSAYTSGAKAEAAVSQVEATLEDLETRVANGEFNGKDGEKGDKGDTGESGITTPVNGFFTLSVDSDGNLWSYSAEFGTTPDFEYDSDTGNLYFMAEVS